MISILRGFFCAWILVSSLALADDGPVCTQESVPLERRFRQLSLDLLGRPPTLEEYERIRTKGVIDEAELRALMTKDEFYDRMKSYHRALLRSNIVNAISPNNDSRFAATSTLGYKPAGLRGNPASPLRGQNGAACDSFILQDSCDSQRQDPNLEPAVKTCWDSHHVPMPVSVDYSSDQYDCQVISGATDCASALDMNDAKGRTLVSKLYFYCDMRRATDGKLIPHLCLPDASKPQTASLVNEVLDGDGRVTAFVTPSPTGSQLARLDRCTLTLGRNAGVTGRYAAQAGCVQREGVVMAPAPYWDQTVTEMPMCAIEAQTRTENPFTFDTCEATRFLSDRTCGCGEGARRCEPNSGTVHTQRIQAFNEEPLRIADSILRRNEDYFSMLTTRRSFVNGPLSQLYRNGQSPSVWAVTPQVELAAIPDVPFSDTTTWVEYTRGPQAAGVLTTPSWLFRFPTQRARVNQFSDVFLCKHFVPPANAVAPPPEDACHRENNLAKRCGCSYCHATIEPMGAHWGRFGERSAQYLDPVKFPRFDARCRDCALSGDTTCNNECGNYVMQAFDGDGAQSLGLLRTYLYRTPAEEENISGGPQKLVERMLQTGEMEKCAVRNIWNAMLGRSMTQEEERLYLAGFADAFARSQHNLRELILSIVSSDSYRRVD